MGNDKPKDKQYNGQQRKRTKNEQQNIVQKTKDRPTRTAPKTKGMNSSVPES